MPELTVLIGTEEQRVTFQPGPSLREILEEAGYQVRSACRGHGACGLCEVRLVAGEASEPTPSEHLHILPERLAQGVRLACQVRPQRDLQLENFKPAPPAKSQAVSCEGFPPSVWPAAGAPSGVLQGIKAPLGVAVDLGTTNIRLALLNLEDGECLAQCRGRNPQASFGADVLTRLVAAQESPEVAQVLGELAVSAIGEGLSDLASRAGIDLHRIVSLAVVGNTAMLALLAINNYHLLLQPQNWQSPINCQPKAQAGWAEVWSIHPQADVRLIQPLAGYVGSDLLAGLVALNLLAGSAPALFIDYGTNSEIALWDGVNLWITSAAGGPAFELWGLSSGMPAEPGAVRRVERGPDGGLQFQVIGGEEPRGFCGSGLIDLITLLLEEGQLTKTGRLAGSQFAVGSLGLNMEDIDALQRAKAAIGAGIQVLSRKARIRLADLQRICVAGEFGRFLNTASAEAIGLLPPGAGHSVELISDAAVRGCGDIILSAAAQHHLSLIRSCIIPVNLALAREFEELFFANLYLEPLRED